MNFQKFKLDLEKAEEPEIKLPTSVGLSKKQEFQKNIYFCFIDYAKAFDWVDHIKLWKILKEMGIPDHLTCLLRNLYAGQQTTVRTGHRTTTDSKLGKEYIKVVYCHPAYLTYMQSTSGGGNGNPLQFSCLENPMDRGAWWAIVHGAQRAGHD